MAIGAKVAGDRERKTIGQIEDTSRVINVRHTMMDKMQPRLTDLGSQAREQNMQLLRGTAQLQAVLNIHDKDATETKDAVNTLLEMLVNARELMLRDEGSHGRHRKLLPAISFPDIQLTTEKGRPAFLSVP